MRKSELLFRLNGTESTWLHGSYRRCGMPDGCGEQIAHAATEVRRCGRAPHDTRRLPSAPVAAGLEQRQEVGRRLDHMAGTGRAQGSDGLEPP